MIRTLLDYAFVLPSFWHHVLQMTTYLINILPWITMYNLSPTQLLYHREPSYTHLRVFGYLCYPLFPSTTINKLQSRSTLCIFLGHPLNHRGYKYFDFSYRKINIMRHVIFDETRFPCPYIRLFYWCFTPIPYTSIDSYIFRVSTRWPSHKVTYT